MSFSSERHTTFLLKYIEPQITRAQITNKVTSARNASIVLPSRSNSSSAPPRFALEHVSETPTPDLILGAAGFSDQIMLQQSRTARLIRFAGRCENVFVGRPTPLRQFTQQAICLFLHADPAQFANELGQLMRCSLG
jgi:hypothetical protein